MVINADGKSMPTYRKIHIPQDPPFYEKIISKMAITDIGFTEQSMQTFAVLICYDQWFP